MGHASFYKLSTTVVVDSYGSSWQLCGLELSLLSLLWTILIYKEYSMQKDVGPNYES